VEDRPLLEDEVAGFRAVDLGTCDVRREQVGRELDAMEFRLDTFGQVLDGLGLGQSGSALDQQVAIGKQGDEQTVDQLFLTEDLGRIWVERKFRSATSASRCSIAKLIHRGIGRSGQPL